MKNLFEIKPEDRNFYEAKIRDFLPDRIIDVHTHVWRGKKAPLAKPSARSWPSRVTDRNPVRHLIETYKLLLPGKNTTPLVFNSPSGGGGTDKLNDYVSRCAGNYGFPALMLSRPEWTEREFREKLSGGGFLGAKPYLSFAPPYIPRGEIRIFDFIPPRQLDILDRRGLILMLHIPRPGRLKDPVNLAQMLEIEKSFPRLKLIIAHAGRAYCPSDTGDAFKVLKNAKNMRFDISANTNAVVFHEMIRAVGPGRILFGSDLPITRMRMKRTCRRGIYVNIVPAGLYGDVSRDRHMEEASGAEADKLTFFLYEEIYAFRRASKKAGLNSRDIEDVFHNNAARLLEGPRINPEKEQLEMELPEKELKHYARGPNPPAGYEIRTYKKGDDAKYVKLMKRAGFSGWDNIEKCLKRALPRGIFFMIHKESGRFAGTCSACHNSGAAHPPRGELSWLAVDPAFRGSGIGTMLCKAVIHRFVEACYSKVYLNTDDFRLPALKTYIKLGFKPSACQSGTGERWKKVSENLNMKIKGLK